MTATNAAFGRIINLNGKNTQLLTHSLSSVCGRRDEMLIS